MVQHLPDRDAAIARMAAAVRPGGWLVVEDVDFGPYTLAALAAYVHPAEHAQLFERVGTAFRAVFAAAGADIHYGPKLFAALTAAGLHDVAAELHAPVSPAGSAFVRLSMQLLRPHLLATGLVTEDDIAAVLAATAEPAFRFAPLGMVTAWGRR